MNGIQRPVGPFNRPDVRVTDEAVGALSRRHVNRAILAFRNAGGSIRAGGTGGCADR